MDLDQLRKRVAEFIDDRDWRQFQTAKDLAESASVESNELLEHFLWRDGREMDSILRGDKGKDSMSKIKDETADILFSCLAVADHLGFDLEEAFLEKMKELEHRYRVDKVKGKVVKFPSSR